MIVLIECYGSRSHKLQDFFQVIGVFAKSLAWVQTNFLDVEYRRDCRVVGHSVLS